MLSPWAQGEELTAREYLRDAESLLQFFYDVNIIGYKEELADGKGEFYHWAHKERTINNIYPKVKEGASKLMINQGIAKSLDIGKKTASSQEDSAQGFSRNKSRRRNFQNRHNKGIKN